MLSFTKRTDYGILALSHLAGLPEGQRANARQMADELGAPPELLAKVLQSMVKEGLVASQMGPGGGYNLACGPSEITIADVVSAIEGPIALTECLNKDEECFLTETCVIRRPMGMIQQRLVEFLKTITLEDMWSAQEGIEKHETAYIHG